MIANIHLIKQWTDKNQGDEEHKNDKHLGSNMCHIKDILLLALIFKR